MSRGSESTDCCQDLLSDSEAISREMGRETKRKYTGIVLSGRALNQEAHRGHECQKKKKKPFRGKNEETVQKSQNL